MNKLKPIYIALILALILLSILSVQFLTRGIPHPENIDYAVYSASLLYEIESDLGSSINDTLVISVPCTLDLRKPLMAVILGKTYRKYPMVVVTPCLDKNATIDEVNSDSIVFEYMKYILPSMTYDTYSDFSNKNQKSVFLEEIFPVTKIGQVPLQYHLHEISTTRITDVTETGWSGFYLKHPNSIGSFVFSRVGYNQRKTQALLNISFYRESLWGHNNLLLLEKKDGRWIVVQKHLSGIS